LSSFGAGAFVVFIVCIVLLVVLLVVFIIIVICLCRYRMSVFGSKKWMRWGYGVFWFYMLENMGFTRTVI